MPTTTNTVDLIDAQTAIKLRKSLRKALDAWLEGDEFDMLWQARAWLGEQLDEHMANAALSVLLANCDVQVYLASQGYLRD